MNVSPIIYWIAAIIYQMDGIAIKRKNRGPGIKRNVSGHVVDVEKRIFYNYLTSRITYDTTCIGPDNPDADRADRR